MFAGVGEALSNVRIAMADAGKVNIPFVSWDGLDNGPGTTAGSFLQLTGSAGAGSYYSHAAIALPKAEFVDRYQARFKSRARRVQRGGLRLRPDHLRLAAGGRGQGAERCGPA